ncbi:MAG TPA: beta-propeller domain-containing protein, partial [Acidimicrobiales bacterium]|nr:beta-propeller domain-containing protein [Acidimicrobiales bacterium]
HTTIVEIDITDPTQPIQVASMVIEGSYVSARVVNDIARIVVSSPPSDLPFVTPQGPSAEEVALAANKQAIVGTTIENWVPSYVYESKEGNVTQGQLVDCKQVSHPSKFSGFTSLSVLDVELTSDMKPPAATSVLTDGETVYASPENLYISTTDYPEIVPFPEENSQNIEKEYLTSIHQFTMKLGEKTEYKASIEVKGHLLNQFAMSEHAGNLRVATTLGAPWGFDESNESVVTVIEISDEGLTEVGQVGGMGKGERIFAVRFVGNLGYVVTFRQTDPFYTLDLTDPKTPKVRGELKITGYSGYLHPIEENLILGIGQEATEEGATTGTKAALYDVEDLDNPKVITTWSPGSGRSSAEWDHHAFLWWPPEGIAVLPIRDWRNDKAEAVLLKIENGDLEEFGRITHSERGSPPDAKPEFMIPIERSLIVGGEIWTYSRGQLQANLMADLSVSKKVQLPILGMELIPGPLTTTEMELIPPTPTSMPVD